jgi:hypothetical protein
VSRLKNRHDVLVLLDPKEAAEGGASYVAGSWMLLFAASNNKEHFKNDIFKTQSFPERFLDPWTMEELMVALPKMDSNVSLIEAQQRAAVVGPLPRYLLEEGLFLARENLTASALRKLRGSNDEVMRILQWNGLESDPRITVAGTMFSVHASFRGINPKETFDINDQDSNKDKAIEVFDTSTVVDSGRDTDSDEDAVDSSSSGEQSKLGYDGSGMEYTERRLEIMNPCVRGRMEATSESYSFLLE